MTEPVRRSQALALLAVVAINIIPHFSEMKVWIIIAVSCAMLWRLGAEFERLNLPGRVLRSVIYVAGFLGVVGTHDTILGQEAGVALLVLASGMKTLETVEYRDYMFGLILCLMLVMAKILENQSAAMTAFMFLDVFLIFLMMFRLHHSDWAGGIRLKNVIRPTIRMFIWATPLMLLMFVFFPRITTRLIPSPIKGEAGFGVSDDISPGDIAELVQTDRLVFRARFTDGDAPAMQGLYWRGGASAVSDGMRWHNNFDSENSSPARFTRAAGRTLAHEIVIEPGQARWLYAFDVPHRVIFSKYRIQKEVEVTAGDSFLLRKALPSRLVYEALSHPLGRFQGVTSELLEPYLQVPSRPEPRAEKLIKNLRKLAGSDEDLPEQMMRYFAEKAYVYTLKPGKMKTYSVDEFLFEKRRGFCSHYATSFATVMRLAGIPARVVWGFHGGSYNNFDGFYSVSTRDAHAWTEVWSRKQNRWVRYDPTTVIAPARIALGGQAFFGSGITEVSESNRNSNVSLLLQRSLLLNLRLAFDAITTRWTLFLLRYDLEFQKEFLKRMGFGEVSALQMFGIVLIGIPFCILWLILRGRKSVQKVDKVEMIYNKFCHFMARYGLHRNDNEGPLDFADRCHQDLPHLGRYIDEFVMRYVQLRYNGREGGIAALRYDLRHLQRAAKEQKSVN